MFLVSYMYILTCYITHILTKLKRPDESVRFMKATVVLYKYILRAIYYEIFLNTRPVLKMSVLIGEEKQQTSKTKVDNFQNH